jgi:replication-associated recombination protein RarA
MQTALYEFKYAPIAFDEMIVSDDVKPKLEKALKEIPNMMLIGPAGVGKGTFTDILLKETGLESIKINCSDETGIDNIREKVKTFATSVGFGGLKIVYLNEADYLSLPAQAMLRDLMESVQKYTRFIFCANYSHKIMPELQSRCQVIELANPPAIEVAKRCFKILDMEGVTYNQKTVIELVKTIWKKRPDIRKTLVTLRENVIDGKLNDTITVTSSEDIYGKVLAAMKSKDPDAVRTLLKSHAIDYTALYSFIHEALMLEDGVFAKDAQAIIHIGTAMRWDALAAIREINFMTTYFEMLKDGTI